MDNTMTETTPNSTNGEQLRIAEIKGIRGYCSSSRTHRSDSDHQLTTVAWGIGSCRGTDADSQCQPADSAATAWTNAISRPILSSQPGGIESAGWRNPYIHRIQGW